MRFSSKSTSSTFSPALKVLSMTRPCFMCLSLVRTNAPPLPGLTCWKSTMLYGWPSNWILSPFLKSAVDTCIALWPFPSLHLESNRLLQPLPGARRARLLPEHAQENLRRLVHEPLLEAQRPEALGCERIVTEGRRQRRSLGRPAPAAQHLGRQARLAVRRIQARGVLELLQRRIKAPRLAVDLAQQAVRLRVPRPRRHDGLELTLSAVEPALVEQRLGEDQPRRGVVREACEPFLAEPDRVLGAARLAVGVRQGGEGERRRVLGQPFFVTADDRGMRGILGRHTGAGPRNRLNHGESFYTRRREVRQPTGFRGGPAPARGSTAPLGTRGAAAPLPGSAPPPRRFAPAGRGPGRDCCAPRATRGGAAAPRRSSRRQPSRPRGARRRCRDCPARPRSPAGAGPPRGDAGGPPRCALPRPASPPGCHARRRCRAPAAGPRHRRRWPRRPGPAAHAPCRDCSTPRSSAA